MNNDIVLSSSVELEEFLRTKKLGTSSMLGTLRYYTSTIVHQPLSGLYDVAWSVYLNCPFWYDHDKTFAFVDLADMLMLD